MKYMVTLNGKKYEIEVEEGQAIVNSVTTAPMAGAPADGTNAVCPMPGTILDVKASVGQAVKAGDVLFILEAMKMENDIVSPADGTVKQILVSKGSTVSTDYVHAVIG